MRSGSGFADTASATSSDTAATAASHSAGASRCRQCPPSSSTTWPAGSRCVSSARSARLSADPPSSSGRSLLAASTYGLGSAARMRSGVPTWSSSSASARSQRANGTGSISAIPSTAQYTSSSAQRGCSRRIRSVRPARSSRTAAASAVIDSAMPRQSSGASLDGGSSRITVLAQPGSSLEQADRRHRAEAVPDQHVGRLGMHLEHRRGEARRVDLAPHRPAAVAGLVDRRHVPPAGGQRRPDPPPRARDRGQPVDQQHAAARPARWEPSAAAVSSRR